MEKDWIDSFFEYWETGTFVLISLFIIFLILASIPKLLHFLYELLWLIAISGLFLVALFGILALVGLVTKKVYEQIRKHLKKEVNRE